MSVEVLKERSISLTFTNNDADNFVSIIEKVCKKKMGFMKGELTTDEDKLIKALDDYFKEED